MSLDTALTSSLSSLRVNQEAISLIAQNIANAGSENYTRLKVTQVSEVVNGRAAGAKIAGVERVIDDYLVSAARSQISRVGNAETIKSYLDRTEFLFGQPGADNSINSFIDDFFSSLSDFANSPEQGFLRSNALERGVALAQKISDTATGLEQIRFAADQEIVTTVERLNSLMGKMANNNAAISEAEVSGGDKNPLFDFRDQLLSEISSIIDVNITVANTGEVTLFTAKGELLTPTQKSIIQYSPAPSVNSLIDGDTLGAIEAVLLDPDGNPSDSKTLLVSASNATTKEINFASGSFRALLDLRDTEIPKMLSQLDELAETLKDSFNAIHNDGIGFPPPKSLTGTSELFASEEHFFSGDFRIAILGPDGRPVPTAYTNGGNLPPLTIDLSSLNGGNGAGTSNVQDIINEINTYFGPPTNKVSLGDLDDIKIAAVSDSITTVAASGTVDFVSNPAIGNTLTIDGIVFTFKDDGLASSGTNIEIQNTLSATLAEVATVLNKVGSGPVAAATYTSNLNTLTVVNDTAGSAGNAFTLDTNVAGALVNAAAPPGTLVGGTDASGTFEFDFEFTNISGSNSTFEVLAVTVDNGAAGLVGTLPADFDAFTAQPGERVRTDREGFNNDSITIDLTGSTLGEGGVHTVSIQVQVTDSLGTVTTDTINYQLIIPDPTDDIRNRRYIAGSISGSGDATFLLPTSSQRFATAKMVDATGKEITNGEPGFLKIETNITGYGIAIDEMDSQEKGVFGNTTIEATNRGLSHFTGLNDFFESGSALKNSAVNLAVRTAYAADPALLATGELTLSNQPADPTDNPIYTYEIGVGSNQLVSRLAEIGQSRISFDAAGTISATSTTLSGYATEIISFSALKNSNATEQVDQEKLLFDGFKKKIETISGVNVDEELANTIIFQNNYAASARMVNLISELFDTLLKAF